MQIDDDVVSVAAKPPCQAEIVGKSAQASPSRCDDDLIQMGILPNDRKRLRFDQVGQVRIWKCSLQRPDQRRGKHDVTNQAEANQKNLHLALWLDCRLVDQHDGDVVLDWIDTVTSTALQRGPVLDKLHLRLAVRAGQNFEQFRIDRHRYAPMFRA